MITLLAVVVIALILFLFYALIWRKNFNRERGKHHEYCVVLIVFILLSLIVSRYLYSVALNVPSKIDVVLIRLRN